MLDAGSEQHKPRGPYTARIGSFGRSRGASGYGQAILRRPANRDSRVTRRTEVAWRGLRRAGGSALRTLVPTTTKSSQSNRSATNQGAELAAQRKARLNR